MHPFSPLFAAGFDWFEALAGSAVLIIWVVSQVINVIRAAGRKPQQLPAPAPRPPAARPPARRADIPPRGPDADVDTELTRQIEEFLRGRAGGGRPAEADRPGQPPPLPPSQSERARPRPKPPATVARAPQPAGRPGVANASGSGVARHVADAFAHELDHLSSGLPSAPAGAEASPQPATVTAELATALRSPATLRQLILLREVLDRPTERW